MSIYTVYPCRIIQKPAQSSQKNRTTFHSVPGTLKLLKGTLYHRNLRGFLPQNLPGINYDPWKRSEGGVGIIGVVPLGSHDSNILYIISGQFILILNLNVSAILG